MPVAYPFTPDPSAPPSPDLLQGKDRAMVDDAREIREPLSHAHYAKLALALQTHVDTALPYTHAHAHAHATRQMVTGLATPISACTSPSLCADDHTHTHTHTHTLTDGPDASVQQGLYVSLSPSSSLVLPDAHVHDHADAKLDLDIDDALARQHPHAELEDDPAAASLEYMGPEEGPGLLVPADKFEYEIVKGFFRQNDEGLERKLFDPELLEQHFGMLDTSPQRWANLDAAVRRLQADAPAGVQYKVVFLARHGQGWHNKGSEKHGVEAWEAHWTFVRGDGELTWGPDPELTPRGFRQAHAVYRAWKREVEAGAPVSSDRMKWYVSPLTRTAQTMLGTFQDLLTGQPEVWEDWREIYGSHTCDERRSRSYLAERFPMLNIEPDMAEDDPLWRADHRESDEQMQVRSRRAFDRVFGVGGAEETYVSITTHSAIIRNMLAVLGHHSYNLRTGEMIPLVLKATPTGR